jgi:Tfp pilus assembly PilM family ATPase
LAKLDDISSTEKLLELIRSNSDKDSAPSRSHTAPSLLNRFKSALDSTFSRKKSVTFGVDLGYDDIKLVKIASLSQNKYELLDFVRVPFEPEIKPNHPDFVKFLKKSLTRYCGSAKNAQIWSNISSAKVELRYLKIPKVSPKQVPNAVYWSHKKVAPYKEAEVVFDFEVLGDVIEDGSPKLAVVSFTAPRHDIEFYRGLFSKSGFPLNGISIVPFSFQNLIKTGWIRSEVKTISSLYIGRDWSRIDIFTNGNLVLSRGIKAGIKTMKEAMRGEFVDYDTDGSIELPQELLEPPETAPTSTETGRTRLDSEKAQEIFYGLIHDISAGTGTNTELQPEEEEIFRMILPALNRLVQQVEQTFEHYTAHFDSDRVEKIYISSGLRPHRRIVDFIGDELGLPRETFDPFVTSREFLGEVAGPSSDAERGSYAPAIGMALSDNAITPNFLYTFKEKAKAARSRLINRLTIGVFIVLMAASFGFYLWQERVIDLKKSDAAQLQSRLNTFRTQVNQQLILDLVQKTKLKNAEFRDFSRKYFGIVVLSEISNLTPSNIRLTSISVQLAARPGAGKDAPPRILTMEGIILGDRMTMEASLADYLIGLSDSPMFGKPVINKKEMGFFHDKEVLRFTAQLELA